MYINQIEQKPKHKITSDFSASGKIDSVLFFLETNLSIFAEKISIQRNTDERIINQKLLRFIETKNSFFSFISENIDESGINKSKPDLGVYEKVFDINGFEVYDDKAVRFFDVECKRLNCNLQHVKQYVHGDTGGIQRFKENKHGANLPQSAMIGYVETNDFDFWHTEVNSWISDKTEHLKMIEKQNIAKLKSKHKRTNIQDSFIELSHFWLKMNFITSEFN